MSRLVRILAESELPKEGELRECITDDGEFCVAHINGQITVLNNVCPHQEGPLAEGAIEEGRIVCPWHGWSFDPKTGAEQLNPAEHAKVYASQIDDEGLSVVLD
jgi:nitrite reductase (NADH) small subunit